VLNVSVSEADMVGESRWSVSGGLLLLADDVCDPGTLVWSASVSVPIDVCRVILYTCICISLYM